MRGDSRDRQPVFPVGIEKHSGPLGMVTIPLLHSLSGSAGAKDPEQSLFVSQEVNIIVKGGNYGWNVKEGTHCFDTRLALLRLAFLRLAKLRLAALEQCPDIVGSNHPDEGALLIDPVVEFANSKQADGLGLTITDGFLYRGLAFQT